MKNNYSVSYRIIQIILFIIIHLAAKAIPSADTAKILPVTKMSDSILLNNPRDNNIVVYPQSLRLHKDQTFDYIQKFSKKRRDYLITTFKTGKKYFPKIVAVLKRFQLPEELKVVIALESGFKANALSRAGALGYWQIMDDVAKEYGLHIATKVLPTKNSKKDKDDRTNFAKSTLAAAKYFRDRFSDLNNNLLLIVASYNCGVGNVRQAMKKSGKPNQGFWDIKRYLPAETRSYVMNFITLNVIFNNYDKFVKNQLVFTPDDRENIQTAGESQFLKVWELLPIS